VLGAPRLRRSDALCWSSDQVKAGREADPRHEVDSPPGC